MSGVAAAIPHDNDHAGKINRDASADRPQAVDNIINPFLSCLSAQSALFLPRVM